jgi:two-component system, OmpR family, alkaline phosphatase synthesis response regulator PhoP
MKRVLIIEDDVKIADLVEIHLTDLDCSLARAEDGETGLDMALSNSYDLIILDVMLPKLDGLEVCKRIRAKENHTPILMLTSKSEELDKVLGLELGADDYLTKPFSIREFIARVKAIFRRTELQSGARTKGVSAAIKIGGLAIDFEKRRVLLNTDKIELTAKEFDLLALFAQKPGRAFNRNELLDAVWGYQFAGYEHTVNSHINRLRAKIEKDPANPIYITTVWGVGYRFVESEDLEK